MSRFPAQRRSSDHGRWVELHRGAIRRAGPITILLIGLTIASTLGPAGLVSSGVPTGHLATETSVSSGAGASAVPRALPPATSPSLLVWNGATNTGFVSDPVYISGRGFDVNVSVNVTWSAGTACSTMTNATGNFTCLKYPIPIVPHGAYIFTATDADFLSAQAEYTVVPDLTTAPDQGVAGTIVNASGYGYAATSVTNVSGVPGARCSAYSSSDGSFACAFVVPGSAPPGTYTVEAEDGQGDIAISAPFVVLPPSYNVTFTESGLAPGTQWSITLNGTTLTSMTDVIVFNEPNGTYAYSLGSVMHYAPTPSQGRVYVHGGAQAETIMFVSTLTGQYAITFTETGLHYGTTWSVRFNTIPQATSGNSISFSIPNGSYVYSIGPVPGYGSDPSNGSVTVSGAPLSFAVPFASVFEVTFNGSSLPSGTNWSVTLTGNATSVILVSALGSASTTLTRWSEGGPTIRFYVSNGSYSYSGFAPGYSNGSGALTVSGQPPAPVAVTLSTSSAPASGYPAVDYLIGGTIVVVVIALLAALVYRKGKSPPTELTDWPAPVDQDPEPFEP